MAIDYSKPSISLVPVLVVAWFDQVRRYVRADQALTVAGDVYSAVPGLSIDPIELSGGTDSPELKLLVPTDLEPFPDMVIGPHAPVTVSLGEIDRDDLAQPPRFVSRGTISSTIANFQGKSGTMQLSVSLTKAQLKGISLGIKCTDRCPWFFGDDVCGATVVSVSATIESITGTILHFVALPNDTVKGGWAAGRYTKGRVELNGLRLLIRKHVVGAKEVVLAQQPPASWTGLAVQVSEGCDKTILACTAHGREIRFGGIGIAMPDHNPIIETV